MSFTASSTDIEFRADLNADQFSKTLPRNYNNSASPLMNHISLAPLSISPQSIASNRQVGKLEYFDLDHSNPPPICKNSSTSASTSNLSSHLSVAGPSLSMHHLNSRHSGFTPASALTGASPKLTDSVGATPGSASGIVYKSVDFIKTEAFKRTRQDAEMSRLKNRSKE